MPATATRTRKLKDFQQGNQPPPLEKHAVVDTRVSDPDETPHLPGEEFAATEEEVALWPLMKLYRRKRDARMALLKEEIALRDELLDAMHNLKLREWEHGGLTVEVIPGKEKVKVKSADDQETMELEE